MVILSNNQQIRAPLCASQHYENKRTTVLTSAMHSVLFISNRIQIGPRGHVLIESNSMQIQLSASFYCTCTCTYSTRLVVNALHQSSELFYATRTLQGHTPLAGSRGSELWVLLRARVAAPQWPTNPTRAFRSLELLWWETWWEASGVRESVSRIGWLPVPLSD